MNDKITGKTIYTRKRERYLALAVVLSIAATVFGYIFYPVGLGEKQPVPFSHKLHSGTKNISCIFCHDSAASTAQAGIPPVQRCMLCHSKIIVKYPPIEKKLQAHYKAREPIEWEKINSLPDHVHFNHGIHVANGVDCGQCHGNVKEMDRIVLKEKLIMGFCIECHRKEKASIDCFNCHY